MANKTQHKRTPAQDAEARKSTAGKKAFNKDLNAERARINKEWFTDHPLAKLSPLPRNGKDDNPRSNRGNGSPTRLSQVKRAVSRIGKPRAEEKE